MFRCCLFDKVFFVSKFTATNFRRKKLKNWNVCVDNWRNTLNYIQNHIWPKSFFKIIALYFCIKSVIASAEKNIKTRFCEIKNKFLSLNKLRNWDCRDSHKKPGELLFQMNSMLQSCFVSIKLEIGKYLTILIKK